MARTTFEENSKFPFRLDRNNSKIVLIGLGCVRCEHIPAPHVVLHPLLLSLFFPLHVVSSLESESWFRDAVSHSRSVFSV